MSSGTDLVATLTITSGLVAGQVLFNRPLGPNHLPRTRWHAESVLWSRWLPRAMRLRVISSGSFMVYGSIIVAWSADATYNTEDPDVEIVRVAALKPSVSLRLNESAQLALPVESARKWYLTGGSTPDLSAHGSILAHIVSDTGGFTGNLSVQIYLDWTIAYEGIDTNRYASFNPTVQPDPGWELPMFTTSDSAWDALFLTLKVKSGGSMVPYSTARYNTIYQCVPAVQCYKSDGKTVYGHFAVLIKDYATKGVVLFDSKSNAAKYAKSGDADDGALKYYKAGPYTTRAVSLLYAGDDTDDVPAPPGPQMLTQEYLLSRIEELESRLASLTSADSVSESDLEVISDVRGSVLNPSTSDFRD